MNALTTLRHGTVPAAFQNRANLPSMADAMQAGLSAGFAVISYKGRNWRIKYRGEDTLIRDSNGAPMASLSVIIVGVSNHISKQWYDKKFSEGDNEAPDCFSVNGTAPDPIVTQNPVRELRRLPQNVWGSRMTENNKKAKACQDTRRMAIVPWGDAANEAFGGPMLLRIPPTSLGNVARYAADVKRFGAEPFMVATQLSFDLDVAYPLIELKAIGWLTDDEANEVNQILDDPQINRILYSEAETTADTAAEAAAAGSTSALAQGAPAQSFQQPAPQPVQAAPEPEPEPVAPPPPPPRPAPPAQAPTPVQEPVAAKPTPFTQRAAAPAQQATPGFGRQAPQPVAATAQAAPAAALNTPAAGNATVITGAPPDMNNAIDTLLDDNGE